MEPLLLAIRADSTHTSAVLCDEAGFQFGQVRLLNFQARSTRELLERAFQEASLDYVGSLPPVLAVVALPGLDTPSMRRSAAETVRLILPKGSRILLCDELEPLLAGGLGGDPGILLVSGHRAMAGAVEANGIFRRIETPMEELGQEGSGLWLGTRTLQLIAHVRQGRVAPNAQFMAMLGGHFGLDSLEAIWESLMESPPNALATMELAKRSLELAAFPQPDPACRALVVRAARRLVDLVEGLQSALDLPLQVATWHGATAAGALLDEVKRQTPSLCWQAPRFSELEGCLFMARAYGASILDRDSEVHVEDVSSELWCRMRQVKEALVPIGPLKRTLL